MGRVRWICVYSIVGGVLCGMGKVWLFGKLVCSVVVLVCIGCGGGLVG